MRNDKRKSMYEVKRLFYKGIGKLSCLSFLFPFFSFLFFILSANTTAAQPVSHGGAQKIGLVLGGGGAKGGAEVGVLKVLEEEGIRPDIIVGTSIGSIIGGLYAAGYSAKELEQMFTQQEWLSLLTDRRADLVNEPYKKIGGILYIFGFPVFDADNMSFGVLNGLQVEMTVDSMLRKKGCTNFECQKIPFSCVAARLMQAEEVVLDKGPMPKAIRASMAIPGIFKPVEINGEKLVDGGMMNNLPVDVARKMGADMVIAIDLQQTKQEKRQQADSFLTGIADAVGLGPIVRWIFSRPDIDKYYENRKNCDIYINPPLPDADASSFGNNNMRRMISIGEKEARKQLPRLRQLTHKTN